MSEPVRLPRGKDATPPMPLLTAVELASQHVGRSVGEVRIAIYYSAMELEAKVAEDPDAPRSVRRWSPHWAILFAGEEGYIDVGDGPAYTYCLGDTDGVSVFDDGAVMTSEENEAPN